MLPCGSSRPRQETRGAHAARPHPPASSSTTPDPRLGARAPRAPPQRRGRAGTGAGGGARREHRRGPAAAGDGVPDAEEHGRGGGVPARPVHAGRDRGAQPPPAGRPAAGPGPALRHRRRARRSLHHHGDAGGPVAAPRRGRLRDRARADRVPAEHPHRVTGPVLRMALPSKGRLAEPAARLLHEAGVGFEPNGRTLFAHCQHVDLELLFARSDDIPVWTADGGVDLGIAGSNQVEEAGVDVERLMPLGFGGCRLTVAVPADSGVAAPGELGGARVATADPRTVAGYFDRLGVAVTVVPISGSVELAPRLAAAEAIVDLVSSGETLRANGLRELETVLESEAVLIARRGLP